MCSWCTILLLEGNSLPYSSFATTNWMTSSFAEPKRLSKKHPKYGAQAKHMKKLKMLVFSVPKRRMLRFFLIQPARLSENWIPDLVLALEVWPPVWLVVLPVVWPLVSPVPTWKALEMAAKPWALLQRQEKEYLGTLTV